MDFPMGVSPNGPEPDRMPFFWSKDRLEPEQVDFLGGKNPLAAFPLP